MISASLAAVIAPATACAKAHVASVSTVRPAVGGAMGIVPAHGVALDIASGEPIDVVYHGGAVMGPNVVVHTVFWAPPGYQFGGSPGSEPGSGGLLGLGGSTPIPGYEAMQQQFFTDVAHDSGSQNDIYSLLNEYPDHTGNGSYQLSYNAAVDSVNATDPFPPKSAQCASAAGAGACVTDTQVGRELDKVISASDPAGRGLNNVWFMYLPPGVDECYQAGTCGTNAFGGYHSVSNVGHGVVIYAVIIDPIIEVTPSQGSDPEGNPDAEAAVDVSAHELFEALTNPTGVGWMDPNGEELADKCENGPQLATPLGYASNGAPYDQVINGHEYLIQGIWSNASGGCIDRSSLVAPKPSLPTISMTQFSPYISGNIGSAKAGIKVAAFVARADEPIAGLQAVTRADGSWGPVALRAFGSNTPHAFGDDRDQILIAYSKGGPKADAIETGSGGNPFNEAGWTGWYDLDTGFAVGTHSVLVAPCTQVGVLDLRVGGSLTAPPTNTCGGETGVATVKTKPIGIGTPVTLSSADNRAIAPDNEAGALVNLTVPLGEPGSIGFGNNSQVLLFPSGFPTCDADLRSQLVYCNGLVPEAHYTLTRVRGGAVATVHQRTDFVGQLFVRDLPGRVRGGDVLVLRNAVGRVLTRFHVAHLKVAIKANQTVVASGTCEPGDYYGRSLLKPPISKGVLQGGDAGTGTVCPPNGHANGLSAQLVEQEDDLSGGITRTEVPYLEGIYPTDDGTVYGTFTALCKTFLPTSTNGTYAGGLPVSLTITPVGSPSPAFHSTNVDTASGAQVSGLAPGVYHAKWVVTDVNGDTRTYLTRFVEA